MSGMLETLKNSWKIPDLRKKLLITIGLLIIFRLGSRLPVPYLDSSAFESLINSGGQLFNFLNVIGGGAFKNATIFAMSITPYINASIIMQLLTIAIPKLEQLSKEGEEGRKKIGQWIRYVTVILAFFQATAITVGLKSSLVSGLSVISFITVTFTLTAGTAFLMWLGEQITEYGIGNGISMLIFAGIVSSAPTGVLYLINNYQIGNLGTGFIGIISIIAILLVFVLVIACVVWVNQAERRIPVQYAKRVVGRKVYGGQSTHLPIKVNWAGVIPIIFAMSIMMLPSTLVGFFGSNSTNAFLVFMKDWPSHWSYAIFYGILIVAFTFFYTYVQFNPIELANNMKKNGGFIPGIRPGKPTSDYIAKVLNRITWFGALFLAVITLFPYIIGAITGIQGVWFAGTSVLILVGVALDTVRQIESQMLTRHYKGFLE
ncbi:preprotein translocase subunit SecY [Ruminiclostridium herbifermentans]|nr:preprotein translocase subunit SecY [Ruminiclostridium herbifermentans]